MATQPTRLPPRVHALRLLISRALVFYQDNSSGQIKETHSISAGLDYPGVGPEHAWLKESGRAEYIAVDDAQAILLKLL